MILFLVLTMVASDLIQIGRFGCPQWSGSETDQSSTWNKGSTSSGDHQKTRELENKHPQTDKSFFLTDIHEYRQRFDVCGNIEDVANFSQDDRPFQAEESHGNADQSNGTELRTTEKRIDLEWCLTSSIFMDIYDEKGIGNN